MNRLSKAISNYLTMRRQFGYNVENATYVLNSFAEFMAKKKRTTITTKLVLEFGTKCCKPSNWTTEKIGIIRRFAKYQQAIDPRTEIPPLHLLRYNYTKTKPYIFSNDEIVKLLKSISKLVKNDQLANTFYTFFGLIIVTGMRTSEAISLNNESVDLSRGIIEIRYSKFQKSRKLPLHPTTIEMLKKYVKDRDNHYFVQQDSAFFVNSCGNRLNRELAQILFRKMCIKAGVGNHLKPRIMDFRHCFAIRNLMRCYQEDLDVDQTVAILATYLGHENPEFTYWYLTSTPELFNLINLRVNKKYWRNQHEVFKSNS